jgi:hypothetical protein
MLDKLTCYRLSVLPLHAYSWGASCDSSHGSLAYPTTPSQEDRVTRNSIVDVVEPTEAWIVLYIKSLVQWLNIAQERVVPRGTVLSTYLTYLSNFFVDISSDISESHFPHISLFVYHSSVGCQSRQTPHDFVERPSPSNNPFAPKSD